MRRHKHLHLIVFLAMLLVVMLIVNVILHVRIYVVYSSGVGPFFFTGLIILTMVALYFKR
ncbi:hypothetical protein JOC95_001943 [Bacillus tianshenii]|uniref:Uncharacterized protein n=1 Tax=Sutcliffiella tianshenii TaxID=1463404 RepID=A0ABS2NZN1_9BACI|nr:hypothetical protein [Bacillus tianshenii]MBM7620091.1 hypothetical protein [Bacillus tianshenii]